MVYNILAAGTDTASMPIAAEWIVFTLCADRSFSPRLSEGGNGPYGPGSGGIRWAQSWKVAELL